MQKGEVYADAYAEEAVAEDVAATTTGYTGRTEIDTSGGEYHKEGVDWVATTFDPQEVNENGTYDTYTGRTSGSWVTKTFTQWWGVDGEFSAATASKNINGKGVKETIGDKEYYVFEIGTAEQLAGFFRMLNYPDALAEGKTIDPTVAAVFGTGLTKAPRYDFSNAYIRLTRDIDLTGIDNMIYTADGSSYFNGVFDGQGHVIANRQMSSSAKSGASLFGGFVNATVKNVAFIDCTVNEGTGASYLAGLAVWSAGNVTIENVYISGSITGTANRVGGLIGRVYSGNVTISNCTNACAIEANTYVGGFIGYAKATSLQMTNCKNEGDVTYNNTSQNGGFIGRLDSVKSVSLKNCVVSSEISPKSDLNNNCSLIGGFFGYVTGNTDMTINTCTFSGTVEGDRSTGGMIGLLDANQKTIITSSTVSGTINVTLAAQKNLFAGGFVGGMRSVEAKVYENTFSGNLNVTINDSAATKEWHTGVAPLVGSFADKAGRGTLSVWNNTIGGTMKVVENDGDSATQMDNETQYAYYAGKLIGVSGGRAQVSYLGGNDVSGLVVNADTNIDVMANGAGALGADMVKVEGYQLSQKSASNTYDIRFVASTRGQSNGLGFVVGVKYIDDAGKVQEKLKTVYAEHAYESIRGTNKDGVVETYTAAEFGNKYLYTLVIKNVPASYVEVAAGEEKFGITLIPFQTYAGVDVSTVEDAVVETPWKYDLAGVPSIYGKLPTNVAENTISLTNVGTYTSLEALYKTGESDVTVTPTQNFAKDSYKNNLYYNVDTSNGGKDYCVYPNTNAPFSSEDFAHLKNANLMTYTVADGIEEGEYDLVIKLRVKNTTARKLLMYLNDGEDGYLVGYVKDNVTASSSNEEQNTYYVKVGTFTFKSGDTITFKIDTGIGSAMHVRGLYLVDPANDVAVAEPAA